MQKDEHSKDLSSQGTSQGNINNYRELLESVDEGFCIIQVLFDEEENPVDYRFLETNKVFEKQTGLKDAQGKTMRDLQPDIEIEWIDIYGKVALKGRPVRFERFSEAMKRYFDVYAASFGDSKNNKVALLFRDVTRQKKSEFNNAWLGAIIESSDDAIVSKNLEGDITSWNEGAERLFGYTAAEAIGNNIRMIIPEHLQFEEDEFLEQLRKGDRIKNYETVRKRKDGDDIHVSLTISPVRSKNGDIVGASKIARNITNRRETEKKLMEVNETLEERVEKRTEKLRSYQNQLRWLTARLNEQEEAHRKQISAELHSNLGQLLALANMRVDSMKALELPEGADLEIEELSQLIEEALAYTRELMVDLKPPPMLNQEDFGEVLEWLVQKMEKYGLEVTVEDDGQFKPLAENVQATLQPCVQELLFNVVNHSGVNEAEVLFSRNGDNVQISVIDDGGGFTLKNQQPEPTQEGGFGLFNIYERMDYLGGSCKIFTKPGEGTKAVLTAPIKDPEIPESTESEGEEPALQARQEEQISLFPVISVLLVDDHKVVRGGLRKMIDSEEDMMIIAEASNGEEAIQLTNSFQPDVIVMDVDMPGINGVEATKRISVTHPDIKIIGLSLHDSKEVNRSMINAGASAYLSKEQGFETLCNKIRSISKK